LSNIDVTTVTYQLSNYPVKGRTFLLVFINRKRSDSQNSKNNATVAHIDKYKIIRTTKYIVIETKLNW